MCQGGIGALVSSVLHLRGTEVVKQPVQLPCGTLCWNGELFGGLSKVCARNRALGVPGSGKVAITSLPAHSLACFCCCNNLMAASLMCSRAATLRP